MPVLDSSQVQLEPFYQEACRLARDNEKNLNRLPKFYREDKRPPSYILRDGNTQRMGIVRTNQADYNVPDGLIIMFRAFTRVFGGVFVVEDLRDVKVSVFLVSDPRINTGLVSVDKIRPAFFSAVVDRYFPFAWSDDTRKGWSALDILCLYSQHAQMRWKTRREEEDLVAATILGIAHRPAGAPSSGSLSYVVPHPPSLSMSVNETPPHLPSGGATVSGNAAAAASNDAAAAAGALQKIPPRSGRFSRPLREPGNLLEGDIDAAEARRQKRVVAASKLHASKSAATKRAKLEASLVVAAGAPEAPVVEATTVMVGATPVIAATPVVLLAPVVAAIPVMAAAPVVKGASTAVAASSPAPVPVAVTVAPVGNTSEELRDTAAALTAEGERLIRGFLNKNRPSLLNGSRQEEESPV